MGLDEGDQGRVPHRKAVCQLCALIRSLNGVSLLVYCMRIKGNSQANWVIFYNVLCAKKMPIIAVETAWNMRMLGCEKEGVNEGAQELWDGS